MIEEEVADKLKKSYTIDGSKTKSEFVERAIIFYCGYVTAENSRDYLPRIVISTIQGTLDSFENRMAKLLFKIAVEISLLNKVTASITDFEDFDLDNARVECINDVKRINGSISLAQAVRDEENK
jgi:hypothetical protein